MSKQKKIKTETTNMRKTKQRRKNMLLHSNNAYLWSIKVCADILRNNKFRQVYMADFWQSVIIYQPSTIDKIKLSFTSCD